MNDTVVLFVAVPLVTAFIGYITNVAAVRMIFHPRTFVGIGPIGWQGVIYRLAPKLAAEIATTTSKVLTPADIVARLRPGELVDRVASELASEVEDRVAALVEELHPGWWATLGAEVRTAVTGVVLAELKVALQDLVAELAPRAGEVLDLDAVVVEMLSGPNADRLARVAKEVGERELRFIELYGGVFGLGIGIVQAAAFEWLGDWWLMPIVGAIVGLLTNWLAIQMIFRPLEPRRFLGLVTYQGMFPKRQQAIAADYGRMAAHEVLTPAKLMEAAAGPGLAVVAPSAFAALTASVDRLVPAVAGLRTSAGGISTGTVDAGSLTATVVQSLGTLAPAAAPIVEEHLHEHLGLDGLIEERLGRLDKRSFERMLRGIFEEDEFILVVIGGVLGGAVGVLQAALVLALGV